MSGLSKSPSQVLMLVSTHCQLCAPVLASLSELLKEGVIDSLEIINVEKNPEAAEARGVQSVPWLRIGWFELEGVRTKNELQRWIMNTTTTEGVSEYYAEILSQGRMQQCLGFLQQYPDTMASIFKLMSDPEEKINVKLGVGVIMEEHASTKAFEKFIPNLIELLEHTDSRIKLDVCHYLSLTNNPSVIKAIEPLLGNASEDVREEAEDSIASLQAYVKH